MRKNLVLTLSVLAFLVLISAVLFYYIRSERPEDAASDVTSDLSQLGEDENNENFLTYSYFKNLNKEKYFFSFYTAGQDFVFTRFAQAVSGDSVVTIAEYFDVEGKKTKYSLTDSTGAYLLDIDNKKYKLGAEPTESLFADVDLAAYKNYTKRYEKEYNEKTYRCESFGNQSSSEIYYFDDDGALFLIETLENDTVIKTMRGFELLSEIPGDILLSIPSDFTPSNVILETEYQWPEKWGELTPDP